MMIMTRVESMDFIKSNDQALFLSSLNWHLTFQTSCNSIYSRHYRQAGTAFLLQLIQITDQWKGFCWLKSFVLLIIWVLHHRLVVTLFGMFKWTFSGCKNKMNVKYLRIYFTAKLTTSYTSIFGNWINISGTSSGLLRPVVPGQVFPRSWPWWRWRRSGGRRRSSAMREMREMYLV